ncbi:hypothetical protein GGI35DRAFT_428158 [Trichoderma velutinum]
MYRSNRGKFRSEINMFCFLFLLWLSTATPREETRSKSTVDISPAHVAVRHLYGALVSALGRILNAGELFQGHHGVQKVLEIMHLPHGRQKESTLLHQDP